MDKCKSRRETWYMSFEDMFFGNLFLQMKNYGFEVTAHCAWCNHVLINHIEVLQAVAFLRKIYKIFKYIIQNYLVNFQKALHCLFLVTV